MARPKTGGRKKGTPNKKTSEQAKLILEAGITPLEYMLEVMRAEIPDDIGPADKALLMARKLDAAKAAAPYVHARLASVEVDHSGLIQHRHSNELTDDELLHIITGSSEGIIGAPSGKGTLQ
jgi:hypothetical protein